MTEPNLFDNTELTVLGELGKKIQNKDNLIYMEHYENNFNEDDRFKIEADKSLIYDSKTGADICMYFDEETRDWLLNLLNTYVE